MIFYSPPAHARSAAGCAPKELAIVTTGLDPVVHAEVPRVL
jgi:hypothetical protein